MRITLGSECWYPGTRVPGYCSTTCTHTLSCRGQNDRNLAYPQDPRWNPSSEIPRLGRFHCPFVCLRQTLVPRYPGMSLRLRRPTLIMGLENQAGKSPKVNSRILKNEMWRFSYQEWDQFSRQPLRLENLSRFSVV